MASDILGDIYVIPLNAILDDISWQFDKPVTLLPNHQIAHTNAVGCKILGDADIDRDGHDLENLGYGTSPKLAFQENRHDIQSLPGDATTDSGYASMRHSPNNKHHEKIVIPLLDRELFSTAEAIRKRGNDPRHFEHAE